MIQNDYQIRVQPDVHILAILGNNRTCSVIQDQFWRDFGGKKQGEIDEIETDVALWGLLENQ